MVVWCSYCADTCNKCIKLGQILSETHRSLWFHKNCLGVVACGRIVISCGFQGKEIRQMSTGAAAAARLSGK